MKIAAILLVQCPDRKGLDATIAEFIYRYDGNILHFEQHQAGQDGAFGPVAHKFGMNYQLRPMLSLNCS